MAIATRDRSEELRDPEFMGRLEPLELVSRKIFAGSFRKSEILGIYGNVLNFSILNGTGIRLSGCRYLIQSLPVYYHGMFRSQTTEHTRNGLHQRGIIYSYQLG